MPSGAKKRKAAKKKLQKAHNNGAHPQANDDPRSHDDRVSDGGDLDNHEEGTKEKRSGQESDGKGEYEVQKSSSGCSSSSGSSSDNEEIVVEKEKSVVFESRETEHEDESVNPEVVVHEEIPESVGILAEDNVSSEISKEESVPIEESGVKQTVEEVLPEFDEKEKISSVITNLPESADITVRENETLLPPSSGVPTEKKNGGVDHHVNESEKQALVSSAPVPVRRTSWMDCCGLSEVFSGGSSR